MLKIVWPLSAMLIVAVCVLGTREGFAVGPPGALTLTGDDEVPAVKTSATGSGSIAKGPPTQAMDAATPVMKSPSTTSSGGQDSGSTDTQQRSEWTVPEGTRLSDDQFQSYKAGNMYVNVLSAANPGGEIRAQIK